MGTGIWRQIRRRLYNRLDAGLFVIGNDRDRVAGLLLGCGRGLFNKLYLPVNAQNLHDASKICARSTGSVRDHAMETNPAKSSIQSTTRLLAAMLQHFRPATNQKPG
jgi:hypothetical protein